MVANAGAIDMSWFDSREKKEEYRYYICPGSFFKNIGPHANSVAKPKANGSMTSRCLQCKTRLTFRKDMWDSLHDHEQVGYLLANLPGLKNQKSKTKECKCALDVLLAHGCICNGI